MKKRVFSIMMVLCLLLSLLSVTAWADASDQGTQSTPTYVAKIGDQQYETLGAAMEKAASSDTITLLQSTTETLVAQSVTVLTIDLGGYTLTLNNTSCIVLDANKSLTIQNGNIVMDHRINNDGTYALFNINTNCSIKLDRVNVDSKATVLYPQGDAATVDVIDSIIKCGVYAVGTNAATVDNYNVKITLKNSTISSGGDQYGWRGDYDSCPVMINVAGTLDIEDCTITGTRQGVVVRAGTATIKDSTITTTGQYGAYNQYYASNWGSGDEVPSAALTVGNYVAGDAPTYCADALVTIENTKISGENGFAALYVDANTKYIADVSISGNSEIGTIQKGQQTVTDKIKISITGGTFSADPTEYVAQGYVATESSSNYVVGKQQFTVTFKSDANDENPTTTTVAYGEKATKPTDPTKNGYKFLDWYAESDNENAFSFDTAITGDITLTAKWEENSVTEETPSTGNTATVVTPSGSSTTTTASVGTETADVANTQTDDDVVSVTTVTDAETGTVTTTTEKADGSTTVVEAQTDGTVTTTDTAANGVKVVTVDAPGQQITAAVTLPENVDSASVTIPADLPAGMVAMDADTGEIIMLSYVDEDGMVVKVDGSANIILVDNSKDFADVADDSWAADAVAFASSHELFNGTGEGSFEPDGDMTRAMLMTVMARLAGVDTDGGETWYQIGMDWATENGITDGSNPDGSITREQLVTMLYRYAGTPAVSGSLSDYADGDSVSSYAADAMAWAVENGILNGIDGSLVPGGSATRAQVAAILMRYCKLQMK